MSNYTLKDHNLIINQDKSYVLKIKDLASQERPREKLLKHGPAHLKTAELIAILLGTGTKKEEVMVMATRLLKDYGEKSLLSQTKAVTISKELEIPITKACQLVACFELGRRFLQKNYQGKHIIRSSKDAFDYLIDMRLLKKEQFRGLYLNHRYQLIYDEVISLGTVNASLVHPREVFKPAIEHSASAIIIAHNHPSGQIKASEDDIKITQKLKEAGELLGIQLLDHLIIANNKYISVI